MAQKLFVGGLAFATTDQGLQEFFSQAGESFAEGRGVAA
jgi:hypothetical protein